MLPQLYDGDPIERGKDLEQLQSVATTFKSRRRFLADLALEPPSKSEHVGMARKQDGEQDSVTISTIHSAKGLEFSSVYVVNVTQGGLPSSRVESPAQLEEERRLLYVAMTRAENELTLMVPMQKQSFGMHPESGMHNMIQRSEFIPNEILDCFDVMAWPTGSDQDDEAAIDFDQGPSASIIERIQSRWRDR